MSNELHCHRCIYSWTPRNLPARICPRCKSRKWAEPKLRPLTIGDGLGIREVVGPHRARLVARTRRFGATRVRVFGSVRRREATAESDLDLLVDGLPRASLLDLVRLRRELSKLIGRPVHIVEEDALPWAMRPQVLAEAVPL